MMSIDIFGRLFRQAGNSNRGPPGIGFKVTNSGNYDLDGKRLCNVAWAEESNDAVNLQLVLDLIKKETDTIHNVIASLRTEIFNKNMIIDVLESTVNQKLKNIQIDHKSTQLLALRNSELISELDIPMKLGKQISLKCYLTGKKIKVINTS